VVSFGGDPPGGEPSFVVSVIGTIDPVPSNKLLRFAALGLGLGLLLLLRPLMGLAKPLLLPETGATTAICDASSSTDDVLAVRISAALSRTEGTERSSCSEVFARGIR
jgi:hypothetical protein